MGNNLPPHVKPSDPDAPWNQDFPEPTHFCPHCDIGYRLWDLSRRTVEVGLTTHVIVRYCPGCSQPVKAVEHDFTEGFLNSMRYNTEKTLEMVDSYSELPRPKEEE